MQPPECHQGETPSHAQDQLARPQRTYDPRRHYLMPPGKYTFVSTRKGTTPAVATSWIWENLSIVMSGIASSRKSKYVDGKDVIRSIHGDCTASLT